MHEARSDPARFSCCYCPELGTIVDGVYGDIYLRITTDWSTYAYGSFATIFNPQTELDHDLKVLSPIGGDAIEAGPKGEWFAGRLNASAAVFRVRQRNTAESDGFDTASGQTLYRTIDATSKGIEFDVGGTIAPGLQVSGGYYGPPRAATVSLGWKF